MKEPELIQSGKALGIRPYGLRVHHYPVVASEFALDCNTAQNPRGNGMGSKHGA